MAFSGYAFDIYPAATPNGTRLVRLLPSQAVSLAFRLPEVGFGMADGQITIHSSHADATAANFAKHNLVKVVAIQGAVETKLGGFFLEEGDFGALSTDEQGGRLLTFTGPNTVYYLERMILREQGYTENPDVPRPEIRGGTNVPGMWTWGVGDHPWGSPGAIMVRVLEEGFYEPGTPLADATWDFDRDTDSAGTDWPDGGVVDETWEAPIGSTGLDVLVMLLRSGDLHWRTSADLAFQAYKNDPGTDRTSLTFAADKVRFAAGQNIVDGTTRQIDASLERKGVLVHGGDETYEFVGAGPASVQWLDSIEGVRTRNNDRLARIGQRWLDKTSAISDAPTPFRHIVADDELNGGYIPFIHYQPGDTVTIHTGTGDHDFTNFAIPVAAVRIFHDEAGNWFGTPELGAQSLSADAKAFEEKVDRIIKQARAHTHPELGCREGGVSCALLTAGQLTAGTATNGDAENTGGSQWSGGAYQTIHAFDGTHSYGVLTGTSSTLTYTWDAAQTFSAGTRYVVEFFSDSETAGVISSSAAFGITGDEDTTIVNLGQEAAGDGEMWTKVRMCWTPSADRTSVRVTYTRTGNASGRMLMDAVSLYTTDESAEDGDAHPALAQDGEATVGTSVRFRRCDGRNEHGEIEYRGRIHHWAEGVGYDNSASGLTATNLKEAVDELAATGGTPSGVTRAAHGHFIAAYHRDADDAIIIMGSEDGITWTDLKVDALGTTAADSSIIHWDGYWWIVATKSPSSGFRLYRSAGSDPTSAYSLIATVDPDPTGTNSWAPEWVRNADGTPYLHPSTGFPVAMVAFSTDSQTTFTIRETHPTNRAMTSWSSFTTVTGTSFPKMIDPFCMWDPENEKFYLWFKDETAKHGEIFESSALTSGYTALETGDWAGWFANKDAGANSIEGFCVIRLEDGRWRVYFNENNGFSSIRTVYSETTDDWRTGTSTWTTNAELTTDALMGHGSVVWIPGMYDHLRDPNAHAEIIGAKADEGHDHDADYETAGSVATHVAAADPHTGYQKESEKGAASGYASLGADGKVPAAQLPASTGGIGPILITSVPAGSPLVFADLLQNSEGTDLLYASEP